jgi:hypothetical protein
LKSKPSGHVEQLHVTHELCFVDSSSFLNGFNFDQQAIRDKQIKSQAFLEYNAFVFNSNGALIHRTNSTQLQFSQQASFVNALDETWPHDAMDLDCGANYLM